MSSAAYVFGVESSITGQPWRWRGNSGVGQAIAQAFSLPEAVGQVLAGRGASPQDAARVLDPTLKDWLPDPSIFKDMDTAAARLVRAVQSGEKIVIFGDYDVDGATSAAVLIRFLRAVGASVSPYIPDRLLEGYGPSADALVALRQAGADLVVTVDCGTQAFAALEAAQAAKLPVIVVDHHKASWALPPCLALVNPNRLDDDTGAQFGHLAAVGLAFLLAVAVNRLLRQSGWYAGDRREPELRALLDLVALGTVADVAPLTGLNRAFVTQGMKVLAMRLNTGLGALLDIAGLDRAPRSSDLGFQFGPRINAGGRVGAADLGVRLLTTEDAREAAGLALELDRLNAERKALEAEMTAEALALAERDHGDEPVLVIAGEGWHPGVIGIVASRVKDRFHRPVIIIGINDGVGKGSGRSVPGVDLGAAVLSAREAGLLSAGGGHAMAAGLTIAPDQIDALRDYLRTRLADASDAAASARTLKLDAALAPGGVTPELAFSLESAGPYGQGWPSPRVAVGPLRLVKCDRVGADHLRLVLAGGDGARVKAVAFRQADTPLGAALAGASGKALYIAGRLVHDSWNGVERAEIHLDDAAWA